MLYQFLLNFVDTFSFLNVFKYLTFRTGLSFFTSLVIVLIIGGPFIKFFSRKRILAEDFTASPLFTFDFRFYKHKTCQGI